MSLNIKYAEAHELTRQLATLTGETMAQAVRTAVRERLERVRRTHGHGRSRTEVLLRKGRDTAPRLSGHGRTLDQGELLYDEHEPPRRSSTPRR